MQTEGYSDATAFEYRVEQDHQESMGCTSSYGRYGHYSERPRTQHNIAITTDPLVCRIVRGSFRHHSDVVQSPAMYVIVRLTFVVK